MKKDICCFFLLLLCAKSINAQLIRNANFETGDTSQWLFTNPAFYGFAKEPGYTFSIEREAKEGSFAAKLNNTGDKTWCQIKQTIPYTAIKNKERLRLSAYVKTKNVQTGDANIILIATRKGKRLAKADGVNSKGTTDWQKLEVGLVIPQIADSLMIFCSLVGDGMAWFDDLRLQKEAVTSKIKQSPVAKKYLDDALNIISKHALNRDSVDLPALIKDANEVCANAKKATDCYGAITYVLDALNDKHSHFETPAQAKKYSDDDDTNLATPIGKLTGNNIGYIKIPAFASTSYKLTIHYADTMQHIIKTLDNKDIKGWIVDTRDNVGGNCWPMILGVAPILGDGVLYRTIRNSKITDSVTLKNGIIRGNGIAIIKTNAPYILLQQYPHVAVLTNSRVSSSGESVVLSFKNRDKVKIIGEPTHGLTTGNSIFTLSDGAAIILTTDVQTDRLGNGYGGKIYPDVTISDDEATSRDEIIDAAVKWLTDSR